MGLKCSVSGCSNDSILFEWGKKRKTNEFFITTWHYCKEHERWALRNAIKSERSITFTKPPSLLKEVLKRWLKNKKRPLILQ